MDTMARIVTNFIGVFYGLQIKEKTDDETKEVLNFYYYYYLYIYV